MCNCEENLVKEMMAKLDRLEDQNEMILSEIDYLNRNIFKMMINLINF